MTQDVEGSIARLPCNLSRGDLLLQQLRCVTDPEYLRQSQNYDVSDCEAMIAAVREVFEARNLGAMLDKFEQPLYAIDKFVRGITVMVQGLDLIAQIIWGGFIIVLKASSSYKYMKFDPVAEESGA